MSVDQLPVSEIGMEYAKLKSLENTVILIAGMGMGTGLCLVSHDAIAPVIALIGGIVGLVAKSIYDSRAAA